MPEGRGLMREKSLGLIVRFIFFLYSTSLRSGELSGKGIVSSIIGTANGASSSPATPRIFGVRCTAHTVVICLC